MEFRPDGRIGNGGALLESEWRVQELQDEVYLDIRSAAESTCYLKLGEDGIWRGRWARFERMPVEVYPQPAGAPVNAEIDVVYTWVDGDASAGALRALKDPESAPVLQGAATRQPVSFDRRVAVLSSIAVHVRYVGSAGLSGD